MEEILRIQNLSKRYGDMPVLDHVDLSVKKGEVVVIVGPSGCGKSTFLRCMNALEEIQEGKVLLDGELINPCRGKLNLVRQRIGMVFQSYELFPHKTVLQNMTLAPVRVKKKDRREAEEEAREAWNAMQWGSVEDVQEKEAESSSWAELVNLLIDRLFVKIKAVSTVSQSAKHQCGNSHVAATCDYLTSEAAVMQDLLYDIKREIEKRSKKE